MPSVNSSSSPQIAQQKKSSGGFVLHSHNGRDSFNEAQRLFPVVHATPPSNPAPRHATADEMMAPQSISFIADDDEDVDEADNYPVPRRNGSSIKKSFDKIDEFEASLGKLNITSGSRTYRIPSPVTRQVLAENSFQSMESQNENEKGFYISFDNETQPKRPKPPLRTKKSPKKSTEDLHNASQMDTQEEVFSSKKVFDKQSTPKTHQHQQQYDRHSEPVRPKVNHYEQPRLSENTKEGEAMIIGDDKGLDPVSICEEIIKNLFCIFFYFRILSMKWNVKRKKSCCFHYNADSSKRKQKRARKLRQ
jgi:hypothetical protein